MARLQEVKCRICGEISEEYRNPFSSENWDICASCVEDIRTNKKASWLSKVGALTLEQRLTSIESYIYESNFKPTSLLGVKI